MVIFQCAILVISVILLIIGLCFLGVVGWGLYFLSYMFGTLEDENDGLGAVLMPFMIVVVLITVHAVVQTTTGILGIAAVCKRGQCLVLSFMVFCILTCVSSAEFLVFGVFSVSSSIWMERLSPFIGKKTSRIPFFGWIGGFSFIFLLALIASILSCLAKCECCARQNRDVHDQEPERFIASVAPAFTQEMQEVAVM